ncbi:hypothetical protein FOC1_h10017033, partial [Fusarium oxysporum f. sp. cubense race 1]
AMSHTNYAYRYWFITTIRADLKNLVRAYQLKK